MIRINLVAGEKRAVKVEGRSFQMGQLGQTVTGIGILLLVVTALLIGWRFWSVTQEKAQLTRDIEAGRREESRLADVLKQVADFDELKQGQSAPVHMIDQVSRALPEMTWLTSLKQVGYDVTMEGRCLNLSALSDFVANLEASRYFKRPVEIVESAVMPAAAAKGGPDLIRFVVKGTFQMAGIEPTPPVVKAGAKPAPQAAAKPAPKGGN